MDVFDALRVFLVVYICRDRRHRARPVERDPCDDIFEAVRSEVFHELRHASAFQLEDPLRVSSGNHVIDRRIIVVHRSEIYLHSVVFLDHFKSVPYYRQIPEPQEVHLEQPQLLYSSHVELCGKAFVRKVKRHVFVDALL